MKKATGEVASEPKGGPLKALEFVREFISTAAKLASSQNNRCAAAAMNSSNNC
jgi:hypothetical protein